MVSKEEIIAAAKEAGMNLGYLGSVYSGIDSIERFANHFYEAGAASRDAEIAELVAALASVASRTPLYASDRKLIEDLIAKVKKSIRCPLCNYQYGHSIGCRNNPLDQALAKVRKL